MRNLARDFVVAFRALKKTPSLVVIVALSIGLGVGVNAIVYTWIDHLVLDPFPAVRDAGRLVVLSPVAPDGEVRGMPPVSYATFRDWREASELFENGVAAHAFARFNARIPGERFGEPAWGELVSGNFFAVAGITPRLGRTLTDRDEAERVPVVVVSDRYWRRKLDADPHAVGRPLFLNGTEVTVAGVAPPGFGGIIVGVGLDLWVPMTLEPQMRIGSDRLSDREARWLQAFGRLGPGISLSAVDAELDAMARRVSAAVGESPVRGAAARLVRDTQLGSLVSPLFTVLLLVTGLVLLTASANVANLLLAREATRQKETGLRLALGASRARVVSHTLAESTVLALLGGAVGLFIARWADDIFRFFLPAIPLPVSVDLAINNRVVGAVLLATIASALAFGLVPALRASRQQLVTTMKEGGARGAGSRFRNGLVVTQVAIATVALVLAGLFLQGLATARSLNVGYEDPSRLLLVGTDLDVGGIDSGDALAVVERLLEGSRALPGVVSAAASTMVPLGFGGHAMAPTRVEGYVPLPDETVETERVIVSDGYFETMGIPIVKGRAIESSDRSNSFRSVVVNETFASRYWPGLDPLGRRVDQGKGWAIVVGVAGDSTYADLGEAPYPVAWSPLAQESARSLTLLVRCTGAPRALVEPLRSLFASVHADLPVFEPRTFEEHMAAASFVQFVGASALAAFGGLSLLLSAVGVFGVMSYTVSSHRRDIAIAIALGATSKKVVADVLERCLRLVVFGLAIGGPASFLLGRIASGRLLGVSADTPWIYVLATALVMLVGLGSSLAPALRASRSSPMTLLK